MIDTVPKWTTALCALLLSVPGGVLRGKDCGYPNYHDTVPAVTTGRFVALPGTEVAAALNPEPENDASSHTLALGEMKGKDNQLTDEYSGKLDRQQDIISKIAQLSISSVAVHPRFLRND